MRCALPALSLLFLRAVATAAPALGAGACAHGRETPPEVVRGFAGAVGRGEWDRAYARMSERYRKQTPLDRFRSEMETDRAAVAAEAVALARGGGGAGAVDRPVRAVIETAGGDRVALVLERGEWRLDEQPLLPYGQQTPRAALRTFVRAVTERRYDVVLRLVPARRRSEVTPVGLRAYWEGPAAEPHRRILEALRSALESPIVETGPEARMPYGDEGMVRFVLEEGIWKIEDVE